jgi:hypothetical protein
MLKRIAITSLAAAALFSTAAMASAWLTPAAAQINVTIGTPPPPVYEAVPASRAGYVWAPGHYVLVNDRYVWTRGQWIAERPGYRYVPASWERFYASGREQWRFVPSRWDRNGDGIPDRYQRHSGYNENAPWGDRDHDGIPNRYDRYDNRRW